MRATDLPMTGVDSFEQMFDTGRDGDSLDGPDGCPGDASIALGSGRARLRRGRRRRARDGLPRAARRCGPGLERAPATGRTPAVSRDAAAGRGPEPAARFGSRAVDRVCRARCHPRARGRAAGHGRGDAGWRLERANDAGAAACSRGTGGWLDRGLARPDRDARPRRGRRARDPAGVAGRPDPGGPRGGPRDRRVPAGGSRGGPARHRPAGATAREGGRRREPRAGWRREPRAGWSGEPLAGRSGGPLRER